jgi:hypothetical protein
MCSPQSRKKDGKITGAVCWWQHCCCYYPCRDVAMDPMRRSRLHRQPKTVPGRVKTEKKKPGQKKITVRIRQRRLCWRQKQLMPERQGEKIRTGPRRTIRAGIRKEIRGNFRKIWSEKLPNFQKTLALPCRFSFLVTCFCQTMC